jgi:hypothetical protein
MPLTTRGQARQALNPHRQFIPYPLLAGLAALGGALGLSSEGQWPGAAALAVAGVGLLTLAGRLIYLAFK